MNWKLIFSQQSYFDASVRPPLLQHLWSLAVEEQFYLLWPLLFAAGIRYLRAKGMLVAILVTVVASAVWMALLYRPGADPSRIYYGTDTRAAGLLLGAALALVWSPWRRSISLARHGWLFDLVGVAAIAGLISCYGWLYEHHPLLYRGGFLLVALCTAAAIVSVTYPHARLVPGMLGVTPLRWVGLRSYGIYLWHWPVFLVTRPYLDVPLAGWPLLLLRLAIVGLIAELSYRYVELPVRQGALGRAWARLRPPGDEAPATGIWRSSIWRSLRVPLVAMLLLFAVIYSMAIDRPRPVPNSMVAPSFRSSMPTRTAVAFAATSVALPSPTATVVPSPTAALEVAAGTSTDFGPEPAAALRASPTVEVPMATLEPTTVPVPVEPVPLDPALVAELQHVLDDTVASGFIPGAVLSISIPGHQPWSGSSGVADHARGLPMEPNTLVHLASITKMFTAVIVLQLAQEGKIDLDAPIGTWLPDIVMYADTTTVRQLLSHTTGIYDYLEDRRFFGQAYQNPERVWAPSELVAMVDRFGPAFQPGAEWDYSSTNYVVLGMLVEQVTGRTLAQEMRQRIFDPLELKHTFFAPDEALEGTLADGYIDASDRADVSMTFVYATGNIISTADDLRRFADALFGGRLLEPRTLDMMQTLVDTGGAYGIPELHYGLGLMGAHLNVGPAPDDSERPQEVGAVLGHIGGIAGFRSAVWHVPESGVTIALSLNQANIDPSLLARDALDVILRWQGR